MNKIILSEEDVNFVFKWRNEHKDEVRKASAIIGQGFAPLESIEIDIVSEKMDLPKLKVFYKYGGPGKCMVEIGINILKRSFGKMVVSIREDGFYTRERVSKAIKEQISKDVILSCVSLWISIMALMLMRPLTESASTTKVIDSQRVSKPTKKGSQKPKNKTSNSVTYILHTKGNTPYLTSQGKRALSGQEFSVRGHFRHYKSGKIVWIPEYKKGNGKKKQKIYKLGGNKDENEKNK